MCVSEGIFKYTVCNLCIGMHTYRLSTNIIVESSMSVSEKIDIQPVAIDK